MASAKFLHPPDRTFVRVYHLMPTEHGINSISLRRLKVALFSEVNDPFELLALNFHKREVRKLVKSFKDFHNTRTGLLCFSANWRNPVLWSHYAASHRGICLGFDLKRNEVQKVVYEENRIRMDLSTASLSSISADLRDQLLRTKSQHWQYEGEYRRFVSLPKAEKEGRLYFWPFDGDLSLKEVILGQQNELSLPAIRELTAATNHDAVVFRARLAFRSFEILAHGSWPP
jgi:hypothetical protein